jgi:hypothetical protein
LHSDNAPEYAGYVMQCICEMFGIDKTFVAVGNSRAMGPCETQHNRLSKAVTEALSKGELRNSIDLDILSATCSIGVNQISEKQDACSNFHLYFGQPANTVFTMVSSSLDLASFESVDKKDKPFVSAMLRQLVRLNKWHMSERQSTADTKARKNMTLRDLTEDSKATRNFSAKLTVGSPVSYKGVSYTLLKCEGNQSGKPITAFLSGKKKPVKFDDLRPLGSARPQKLFPRSDDEYELDDFLFFDKDDQVFSGRLISKDQMMLTERDRDFEADKDQWYPLYIINGDAAAKYSPPKDLDANPLSTSTFHCKDVFLKGSISATHRLPTGTQKALDALMAL